MGFLLFAFLRASALRLGDVKFLLFVADYHTTARGVEDAAPYK